MQNFHCKCHHHQKQGANPTWALPGWVGGTKSGGDKGTFTSTTFQLVFVLLFVRLDQFAFVHFYVSVRSHLALQVLTQNKASYIDTMQR